MKDDSKLRMIQDRFILEAFRANGYNRKRTADYLNCGIRSLQRTLIRLGIPQGNRSIEVNETISRETVRAVTEALQKIPVIAMPYEVKPVMWEIGQ